MAADDNRSSALRWPSEEDPVLRARCHRSLAVAPAIAFVVGLVPISIHAEPEPTSACTPTHEIRDDGTLRLRAGCKLSLAETAAGLDALLAEAFPSGRMTESRASLELGRIVDYPWLSKALAEASLRSPVWNPEKGRGRRTDDNPAVASIVDTRRLLAPLTTVFARHGVRARAGSVEKVLVGEVGETPELAPLASNQAAAGKKLPYDAILWLRLERQAQD
jgi:hypothetical protein